MADESEAVLSADELAERMSRRPPPPPRPASLPPHDLQYFDDPPPEPEKALRYNQGKPPISYMMLFGPANDHVSEVGTQGGHKYEMGNFLNGGRTLEELLDCALRHIRETKLAIYNAGDHYDPDIGTLHLANAAWNLLEALRDPEIYGSWPTLDPDFDQAAFLEKYNS